MLKIVLKFLFASCIIYWLVNTGALDFSPVVESFKHGYTIPLCFGILLFINFLGAYRWKILLEIKSHKILNTIEIIKLNWIGLFFSSILPGAVTGDIIKILYAKDLDPELNKTFLLTSVVMDRIIGLIGLIFLLGTFSLYNYSEIIALSSLSAELMNFNILLSSGVLLFFISIFLPENIQNKLLAIISPIPLLGSKVAQTLQHVWFIGKNKKAVLKMIVLSIVIQSLNITAFYIVSSPFYTTELPLHHIFTFFPLGLLSVAIPISPAGLGVGHAVFNGLFKIFNIDSGASLFNLYFICLVAVNLLGILPYILNKKKHNLKEAEEVEKSLS
jgi:glycosyltransferase 2 family protein